METKNLLSWKEEFLTKTDLEKWIGLLPENLKKHNCKILEWYTVSDGHNLFEINGRTCQLCNYYQNIQENECATCPLYKSLNDKSCFDGNNSPWRIWALHRDLQPMIDALTKIKDQLPQRTDDVNRISEKQEFI